MELTQDPSSVAIAARDLTKIFRNQTAVDHLSFDVPWGRVTGFLGPNGAGKTTTLRMIVGLATPTAGSTFVAGHAFEELEGPVRLVGGLLETQQFHPLRTAEDHLAIYATVTGVPPKRVDAVLEQVSLSEARSKKVGKFSLGMRQRLGLATALLAEPRILILDEPANGLDPAGIRWLRRFIQAFADADHAVFVSSHQLGEISQIADDVVVIDRGRLVKQAAVQELRQSSGPRTHVRTDQPERLRDLLLADHRPAELTSHDSLTVSAPPDHVGRVAAAAGIPVLELRAEEGSLEDVFFELTRSEGIR
jgi:ABC-2 type transport system ATP-binding protein